MEGFHLILEDYCKCCPHFSATVNTITLHRLDSKEDSGDTNIRCKNADICERMYQRLVNKVAEMR